MQQIDTVDRLLSLICFDTHCTCIFGCVLYCGVCGCGLYRAPCGGEALLLVCLPRQLGTLGSGNHYAEIQVVEEIYDEMAAAKMGIEEKGQVRGVVS